MAGHRPHSGDGVIAEVALPRWRYVAGRGLHGRPSVRYHTCRLGAPDAVPRAAKAGAPSKDAWDGPLAQAGPAIEASLGVEFIEASLGFEFIEAPLRVKFIEAALISSL